MEITTQSHPLRTITLRYDRTVEPPAFETLGLQYYQEIHDRAWEIKQRINNARLQITPFKIKVEEFGALLQEAKAKFKHLQVAYDTNPYKGTLRIQLEKLLADIKALQDEFVQPLIKLTVEYFDYDEYIMAHDKWIYEVAFPQFGKIMENYKSCSVDLVFFDQDLDDFKGVLNFVKKQEGKYYEEIDEVVDGYSDLNWEFEKFWDALEDYDKSLVAVFM